MIILMSLCCKHFHYTPYRLILSIKDDETFDSGCGNIWWTFVAILISEIQIPFYKFLINHGPFFILRMSKLRKFRFQFNINNLTRLFLFLKLRCNENIIAVFFYCTRHIFDANSINIENIRVIQYIFFNTGISNQTRINFFPWSFENS